MKMQAPAPAADASAAPPDRAPASERKLVFLLATVQFVNILDFMIVMPLGPDFAAALGIPTSRLGIIGGSYTAAAAVAGLVGALFLDRFDRRRALALAMVGLVFGTLGAAFATSFATLVAARTIAGLFGGPATAIALAILSDAVPAQRRGRAMGAVMGAFAAASVLGVPAGLELAHRGDWRTPFYAVAALGAVVVLSVFLVMPPQRAHLDRPGPKQVGRPLRGFLADPLVRLAFLGNSAAFLGVFATIPNLATFVQYNLGYPRAGLGVLYLIGGVVSFFAMRAGGAIVDRRGPMPALWFGAIGLALLFTGGFVPERTPVPVPALFVGFMLFNSVRMVGLHTLTSKIPPPQERARFMSGLSAVQHIAAAVGAGLSSALLWERADHALGGMDRVAILGAALALVVPFVVLAILRRMAPVTPLTTPTRAAG